MPKSPSPRPLRRLPAAANTRRLLKFVFVRQLPDALALLDTTATGFEPASAAAAESAALYRLAAAVENLRRAGRFDAKRLEQARSILARLADKRHAELAAMLAPAAADTGGAA